DIASAKPITTALCQVRPSANATSPSTSAVASTCALPSPNTDLRSTHRREGCSSRPITNSSSTTPSSAKCMMLSMPLTRRRTGPRMTPAARYPRTAPSLSRRNKGTASTAAATKIPISESCATDANAGYGRVAGLPGGDPPHLAQELGLRELGLYAGARRRVPGHDPFVPYRVHLFVAAHVREPDGDRQKPALVAAGLSEILVDPVQNLS